MNILNTRIPVLIDMVDWVLDHLATYFQLIRLSSLEFIDRRKG